MNANQPQPPQRHGLVRLVLLAALAALFLFPLVTGATLYLAFRPGPEVRTLRQCTEQALGHRLERPVQFAVRPFVFAIARTACAFIDEIPPEARQALSAVRRADVGVYQMPAQSPVSARQIFVQTDRLMTQRGWQRTVSVANGREIVAVFSPTQPLPSDNLPLCVLVLDGEQVVTVAIRGDPRPLVDLALKHAAAELRTARVHPKAHHKPYTADPAAPALSGTDSPANRKRTSIPPAPLQSPTIP